MHEVSTLLDRIAGYDGRSFAPSAQESWFDILAGFPLDDCLRAVKEHYAINNDRVMPADIRTRCFTLREMRAAAEQRALPAPERPTLTAVGIAARDEARRALARTIRKSEHALRPPMRADATHPTSADSTITEEARLNALRRLRHEGPVA